ncbi:MAG: site-specific integrase [Oscillospiraceae bacterium]|nr:site-specific integrase [Oscillospiraceae bacterium]
MTQKGGIKSAARRRISVKSSASVEEEIKSFILAKKAKGLADKTLATYQQHFSAISKHLDLGQSIEKLNTNSLEQMVVSMRDAELAPNSIKSYTRTMKSFLSWCNEEGITDLTIPLFKAEETIKETYSDDELEALLKKPNLRNCKFSEYRNWVIINLKMYPRNWTAEVFKIQRIGHMQLFEIGAKSHKLDKQRF